MPLPVATAVTLFLSVVVQRLGPLPLFAATIFGLLALLRGVTSQDGVVVQRVAVWALAIYAYVVVSGLLSGGMTPVDLASPEFLNADGRVFAYYLPVVMLAASRVTDRGIQTFIRALAVLAAAINLQFLVWLLGIGGTALSTGGLFTGLIVHKTSAGTVYAVIAMALTICGYRMRNRRFIVLGAATFVPMISTGSRQVLLGLAGMAVLAAVVRSRLWRLIRARAVVGGLLVAAFMFPVVAPDASDRVLRVFAEDPRRAVAEQLNHGGWDPAVPLADQLALSSGAEWNLVGRVAFYKRAWDLTGDSLLVGAGFGRYNDPTDDGCVPIDLRPGVCMRSAAERLSTDRNAHNGILQITAELGLLGLLIFGGFWMTAFRSVHRHTRRTDHGANTAGLLLATEAAMLMLPGSLLLGHALGAPNLGIPILTLVAMSLAATRSTSHDAGEVLVGVDRECAR